MEQHEREIKYLKEDIEKSKSRNYREDWLKAQHKLNKNIELVNNIQDLKTHVLLGEKRMEEYQKTSDRAWQEVSADIKEFRNFMSLMLQQLDERIDGLEERMKQQEKPPRRTGDYVWDNTCQNSLQSQTTTTKEPESDEETETIGLAELADQVD